MVASLDEVEETQLEVTRLNVEFAARCEGHNIKEEVRAVCSRYEERSLQTSLHATISTQMETKHHRMIKTETLNLIASTHRRN